MVAIIVFIDKMILFRKNNKKDILQETKILEQSNDMYSYKNKIVTQYEYELLKAIDFAYKEYRQKLLIPENTLLSKFYKEIPKKQLESNLNDYYSKKKQIEVIFEDGSVQKIDTINTNKDMYFERNKLRQNELIFTQKMSRKLIDYEKNIIGIRNDRI